MIDSRNTLYNIYLDNDDAYLCIITFVLCDEPPIFHILRSFNGWNPDVENGLLIIRTNSNYKFLAGYTCIIPENALSRRVIRLTKYTIIITKTINVFDDYFFLIILSLWKTFS